MNNIFTYIGPTLIVINPYKHLEELFSQAILEEVIRNLRKNINQFSLCNQRPHIYAVAASAFKNLV